MEHHDAEQQQREIDREQHAVVPELRVDEEQQRHHGRGVAEAAEQPVGMLLVVDRERVGLAVLRVDSLQVVAIRG